MLGIACPLYVPYTNVYIVKYPDEFKFAISNRTAKAQRTVRRILMNLIVDKSNVIDDFWQMMRARNGLEMLSQPLKLISITLSFAPERAGFGKLFSVPLSVSGKVQRSSDACTFLAAEPHTARRQAQVIYLGYRAVLLRDQFKPACGVRAR